VQILHFPEKQTAGSVLSIGNFDGVHLGHQAVLGRVLEKARADGLQAGVVFFEPQPLEFFKGKAEVPARLTKLQEKLHWLAATQLDFAYQVDFNEAISQLSAEQFVQQVLVDCLQLKHLVVGDDFRFGKGREGDFDLLVKLGEQLGFSVERSDSFQMECERVSSSRIRHVLQAGNLQLAKTMLGRDFSFIGEVEHGQKRGRTIGFPTANIALHRDKSPALGVYAVRALGAADQPINGVANVGSRPTVDGTRVLLEVFLFDFDADIYGRELEVQLLHKLRDEKRYDSFEALKAQIDQDVVDARVFFQSAS
jgi:riboflavin kinase/FMN adenylyltransferase